MIQINFENYKKYKKVAKKVIHVLCENNLSSIYDIETIYNIIRGYPYCLDTEGHYAYNGKFYNSMDELPVDAMEQIILGYHKSELCAND